jgi:chromosome segregation ATPase
MFKLMKKLLLVGIVAGATVVAVKSTKVGGHVRHEAEGLVAWAESQVPVQKKIDKLRRDVRFLDKDIDRAASALAKEIVETRMLGQDVAAEQAALEKTRAGLLARGAELKDARKVGATDKPAPAADAKDRLKLDVARFEDAKRRLTANEKMLDLKERNKAILEGQLASLKTKKLELETAISQAETKFKELQLAQMESKFQTDDTRLARIKADLRELNKLLDIKAEELKLQPAVHEDAPKASTDESVDDILAPVGK